MQYGYLSEHHSTGETAQKAGDYAEDMAMEMLATVVGLPDDTTLTSGLEGGTMETFGKNLQDTEFYTICAGSQGWTLDNCSKCSSINIMNTHIKP